MSDMIATLTLSTSRDFSWGDRITLSGFEDHDCFVFRADRYFVSILIVPRKPTLWQKLISTLKGLFNARPAN
jgi:hypothetical protein